MPEIVPTPDCCEVWPRLLAHFGWFAYADAPELDGLLMMPFLPGAGGVKWRVNHCPACGASVGGCVVTRAALEQAEGRTDG